MTFADPLLPVLFISALGPVVGSLIGVLRAPSERFMFNMMSFAAGVMLTISFLELIPESLNFCSVPLCGLGIGLGALAMFGLDKLLPHIHPELCAQEQGRNLNKTAVYLLIGIFLHNFPEGLAIAVGSISDAKATYVIAVAIAIHNVPEGVCTATPYFHVTGQRLKAFLASASTAIPIVAGYVFARYLYRNIDPQLVGVIVAATAGVMVYISADELIPASCFKLTNHSTIFSLIAGVIFVVLLGAM